METRSSATPVDRIVRTDWRGLPVPEGETPETRIKWWEVDPHPTRAGYILRERSWHDMLSFVGASLDQLLEQDGVESEGCTISFRVVEGTVEQYEDDIIED